MKAMSKKSFVLAMCLIFLIIFTILTFGLYSYVEYFVKEIKIEERGYTQGYYACLASLRYASILLRDPETYFTDPGNPSEEYTVTGDELGVGGDNFFTQTGLPASRMHITITETGPNYTVTANYTY